MYLFPGLVAEVNLKIMRHSDISYLWYRTISPMTEDDVKKQHEFWKVRVSMGSERTRNYLFDEGLDNGFYFLQLWFAQCLYFLIYNEMNSWCYFGRYKKIKSKPKKNYFLQTSLECQEHTPTLKYSTMKMEKR